MKEARKISRLRWMVKWVSRGVFVLVSVLCLGLMVDSYFRHRGVTLNVAVHDMSQTWEVSSFDGTLALDIRRYLWKKSEFGERSRKYKYSFDSYCYPFRERAFWYKNSLPDWMSFGFDSFEPNITGGPALEDRITKAWMPLWFVFLLTLIPLAFIYRSIRRENRFASGLCRKCGYDLRETPKRCPECGTVRLNVAETPVKIS